jgi:putative phosphoesterase
LYFEVMRIAALYDVHGNLPALEAVLRDVRAESVDVVVVGGDVVWGPWPGEVLELLRGIEGVRFIRGNADREVATSSGDLEGATGEVTAWVADHLSAEQKEWLLALPPDFAGEVDGLGDVLFCHGSPRSDEEMMTRLSPLTRLEAALHGVAQRTVVCGHTHTQFRRPVGDHEVVNAGSVGMPYEGRPGAFWALLGPGVDLRRTDYDVDAAARAMEETGCPHVREVFVDTILRPLSPEDAAREFEEIAARRSY